MGGSYGDSTDCFNGNTRPVESRYEPLTRFFCLIKNRVFSIAPFKQSVIKNMDNEFLASLQREGQIETPAEEQEEEKETPPESPAEKEPKEDKPESQTGDESEGKGDEKKPEGKIKEGEEPAVFQAFHKHPRWKALNEELGTLRQFRDEVAPLLPLIKKLGEPGMIEDKTEAPSWFSELFGDNKETWAKYQEYNSNERKQLRTEILTEVQGRQEEVAQATKKQEDWLDGELVKLDEVIAEEKLPKYNRNELMKIAVDFKPTDDKGNISLKKAYDILQMQKGKTETPKSDEKKKIADKTMAKSKSDEEKKDYKTSHDLAGKSFHDLIPE